MMELGDYILNDISSTYPADLTGTGHTNEIPFVFVKFTSDVFKVGYKGILQFWIVAKDETTVREMLTMIQDKLNYKEFGRWLIRKIDYTIPQVNHLTDDRWLQEVTATLIYEDIY
jgi:hypothetical protein